MDKTKNKSNLILLSSANSKDSEKINSCKLELETKNLRNDKCESESNKTWNSGLFENEIEQRAVYSIFVTDKELAKALSLSVMTIRKWRAQEKIPFRKFGRSVRYNVDEVVEAISKKGD